MARTATQRRSTELDEHITVGQPPDQQAVTVTVDPMREYVASGGLAWLSAWVKALPPYIDDVTSDFGWDLYDRMMHDPQVSSAVQLLIMAALEQPVKFTNPYPQDKPEWEPAERIRLFCQALIAQLKTPLDQVLFELAMGMVYGHKVAEKIFGYAQLDPNAGGPQLVITAIKCKPPTATAFVVDTYNNVLGLLYLRPGQQVVLGRDMLLDAQTLQDWMIPREKFAVFTFRPRNGDPRGTSLLRPVYSSWWMKQQTWQPYLAYLATFGQPSIVGYTAENALPVPQKDANGNPLPPLSPIDAMLLALRQVRNGAVAAFPFGSKIEVLQAVGDGRAFLEAVALEDRQITKGILCQTLMTDEGAHMSRSASSTHQDVFGTLVRYVRMMLSTLIMQDILLPCVEANYGNEGIQHLPHCSMGALEHHDFAQNANAVAALSVGKYIHPSQYPDIDAMLGLPARDMRAVERDYELEVQKTQTQVDSAAQDMELAQAAQDLKEKQEADQLKATQRAAQDREASPMPMPGAPGAPAAPGASGGAAPVAQVPQVRKAAPVATAGQKKAQS